VENGLAYYGKEERFVAMVEGNRIPSGKEEDRRQADG
jgi:hypothetical protein